MANPSREMIQITKVDTSRPNKVGVQISDNRWFGVFDKALWPRLEEGAHLNVEWVVAGDQGQYRNITAILGTASSPNGAVNGSQKETNIIREAALKCAVELYRASVADPSKLTFDETISLTCSYANRFVAWITEREEEAPF